MLRFYRTICVLFIGLFLAGIIFLHPTESAPLLANYILGDLPTDSAAIARLAKNQLLIISPEQGIVRRQVIDQIRRLNPQIIILAYMSTVSYNEAWTRYSVNTLYGDLTVQNDWWLRNAAGQRVSNWPGLWLIKPSPEWFDYYLDFTKRKIMTMGIWDGVFWDMIYDSFSWINGGDLDTNGDGARDSASDLDKQWRDGITYLFKQTRSQLGVKYIMMNGSSVPAFQPDVNGRMYESYPTSWEAGGNWGAIMSGLIRNAAKNQEPRLYVFNTNPDSKGNQADYRKMRFGLASSLMADDVYFSFDFGPTDHNQTWWYDEYDVDLGRALASAHSLDGKTNFNNSVWRRDYEHGVAVVNASGQTQDVDLGGEFERIIGTQDPKTNSGLITDRVKLAPKDGIILLKTIQTIDDVVYANGNFLRFYDMAGRRARNGLFAYEESLPGGARVFSGDLNGDSLNEKVITTGRRMEIYDNSGVRLFNNQPFGGDYKGDIRLAVGKLFSGTGTNFLIGPSVGSGIFLYDYTGKALKNNFLPLGKKYKNGWAVAIGDVDGGGNDIILGTGAGAASEILIYDRDLKKIKKRFYPFEQTFKGGLIIAAGDINSDGKAEIITAPISGRKAEIRVYNSAGKKLSGFSVPSSFGSKILSLGASDVNFDGRDEIVVAAGN